MVLESFAIFIVSSLVLVKAASYAVRSILRIAHHLKFSEFFAAFVVGGFIAIMPEFFIGINSALEGRPEIGLGTLIGSNVADLTIVIGIIALVGHKININRKISKNNLRFLFVTSLPIVFMLDGFITNYEGFILILAFLIYNFSIIKNEKIFRNKDGKDGKMLAKNFAIFAVSMVALFISSHFIVDSAINISTALFVPTIIIGLFLVAIGTTLPELTFSLKAVHAKHKEVALGDILGNVAADSTFSIGVISIISPIAADFSIFVTATIFMIFSAILVVTFLQANRRITWNESFALFFAYFLFVIIELKEIAVFG